MFMVSSQNLINLDAIRVLYLLILYSCFSPQSHHTDTTDNVSDSVDVAPRPHPLNRSKEACLSVVVDDSCDSGRFPLIDSTLLPEVRYYTLTA